MPLVVVQVITGLYVHTERTATSLILELQFLAVDDSQFYVIGWSLKLLKIVDYSLIKTIAVGRYVPAKREGNTYRCMEQHCIFSGRFEFKVNISRVTHIEVRQFNCSVRNPERNHVVEQVVTFAHQRAQSISALFFI